MRRALTFSLALVTFGAAAQPPDGYAPRIDDRSGHALDSFHAALARAERRQGRARVLVWGASHTASDQYTGVLRELLSPRFGEGGPGLVPPALPFELYAHTQVDVRSQGPWSALKTDGRVRRPDAYGVTGIALDARPGASAELSLRRGTVEHAELHFLSAPGAGRIVVRGGSAPRTIDARGRREARIERIEGPIRRLSISIEGGPVRLFGVSLEQRAGAIVDALGVPGARMRDRLPWDDAVVRTELERLAPDLVVLAYGTNESGFARTNDAYRSEVDEALARARRLRPGASCLVIGPSDWPIRNPDGTFRARPRTSEVAEVQREAAARHGCGYFDLLALQGGPGSMPRWVEAGLALGDHVHFSDAGHHIIGRALHRALLHGYAAP